MYKYSLVDSSKSETEFEVGAAESLIWHSFLVNALTTSDPSLSILRQNQVPARNNSSEDRQSEHPLRVSVEATVRTDRIGEIGPGEGTPSALTPQRKEETYSASEMYGPAGKISEAFL
jgi:hypothetical protein